MPGKNLLFDFGNGILDVLFPETCSSCGLSLMDQEKGICFPCLTKLPLTDFHTYRNNPVFRQMEGRLEIADICSGFYFRKGGTLQKILHEIKYHKDWKSARLLGEYYGALLCSEPRYRDMDFIIPVPLHPKKQEKRGFNQSEEFALGLSQILGKPVKTEFLKRTHFSNSQSHKTRKERFDILAGEFKVVKGEELYQKKILLVDDVITTGATLEACGKILFTYSNIPIKVVSIAYTLI